MFDEMMLTGAVITGRRTGNFVDYWDGDHHNGVPIFVPTHRARDAGFQYAKVRENTWEDAKGVDGVNKPRWSLGRGRRSAWWLTCP